MMAGVANGRSHPHLQALDALKCTYPGFERDVRDAEAVHFGTSNLTLGFDAAMRRIKVKQRAYEEQRSLRTIHRSHPNLVALDSLKLTYNGWQKDFKKAEDAHNKNPNCNFSEILRKMQVKQLRHENDRSHYRLKEIDSLKLSYPGWKADVRNLEKFHFEDAFFLPGDSLFQRKLDGLKRRQQIYQRSQNVRGNRSMFQPLDDSEETALDAAMKGSFALLLGPHNTKNKSEPKDDDEDDDNYEYDNKDEDDRREGSEGEYGSSSDEARTDKEKTDRQPGRTPYAVIADVDPCSSNAPVDAPEHLVSALSIRPQADHPRRPDPPDYNAKTVRERIDCDGQQRDGNYSSDSDSKPIHRRSDAPVSSSAQQRTWPNRLSSYIEPEHVQDSEVDESEEADEVVDLPNNRYSTPRAKYTTRPHTRAHRKRSKPRGKYSAPPLLPDDDETPRVSRPLLASGPSSSRAVWTADDTSDSAASQSSSLAVWTEDRSVISASSSRAVWAESPKPCIPDTPSSTQAVQLVPETPQRPPQIPNRVFHERSRAPTSYKNKKKSSKEKSHRNRSVAEDRSTKSKASTCSRASSHGSSRTKKLGRCTICGDNDKNHVFVPCGHLCACKECAGQVISRKMACPVCRGAATDAIQVFL